jgi:hypothetical protein
MKGKAKVKRKPAFIKKRSPFHFGLFTFAFCPYYMTSPQNTGA